MDRAYYEGPESSPAKFHLLVDLIAAGDESAVLEEVRRA